MVVVYPYKLNCSCLVLLVHFSEVLGPDRSLTSLILVLQERGRDISHVCQNQRISHSCLMCTVHKTIFTLCLENMKPFWVPCTTLSHCTLESVTCIFPTFNLSITPQQRWWLWYPLCQGFNTRNCNFNSPRRSLQEKGKKTKLLEELECRHMSYQQEENT